MKVHGFLLRILTVTAAAVVLATQTGVGCCAYADSPAVKLTVVGCPLGPRLSTVTVKEGAGALAANSFVCGHDDVPASDGGMPVCGGALNNYECLSFDLPAGNHTVTISAQGYRDAILMLEITTTHNTLCGRDDNVPVHQMVQLEPN